MSDRFDKTVLDYVILRHIRSHAATHIERFRLVVMSSAATSRLVGLLRNDSLANLITHQLLGLGRIDQVYEGLVHRGIHVQIFSHCRHVVRSLNQVVWKHNDWH